MLQAVLNKLALLEMDEVLVSSGVCWYHFGQENWLALSRNHCLETKDNNESSVKAQLFIHRTFHVPKLLPI